MFSTTWQWWLRMNECGGYELKLDRPVSALGSSTFALVIIALHAF